MASSLTSWAWGKIVAIRAECNPTPMTKGLARISQTVEVHRGLESEKVVL
jgi:hypothetical protein